MTHAIIKDLQLTYNELSTSTPQLLSPYVIDDKVIDATKNVFQHAMELLAAVIVITLVVVALALCLVIVANCPPSLLICFLFCCCMRH